MKKIFILCLFVLMTSTLCSCGSAEYSKDESYVDKTKSLVNTSVEYTRIWRENDERFDYTNIDSAKEYINILDELCQTYRKILMLQPTDKFDEYDAEMKENVSQILSVTSQIKSHVRYSFEKADGSLFKKEKQALFDKYDEYQDEVTMTSQYIQTFWRNA